MVVDRAIKQPLGEADLNSGPVNLFEHNDLILTNLFSLLEYQMHLITSNSKA
jgi:hypothetical protein